MFPLYEVKHVQEQYWTSVADAVTVNTDVVPKGKVWVILAGTYHPSAAETTVVLFSISSIKSGTVTYAISIPVSIALSTTLYFPLIPVGQQLLLLPGEFIQTRRAVATGGSSMVTAIRYIEMDIPVYQYRDVQHYQIGGAVWPSPGVPSAGASGPYSSGEDSGGGGRGGRSRGTEPI